MSEISTMETLFEDIRAAKNGRILIAIAGPPGVGKSTFSEKLRDKLNVHQSQSCEILAMDGYHYDDMYLDQKAFKAQKGAPFTFDVGGLVAILSRLKNNQEPEISVPVFDRKIEISRAGARMILQSVNVILVEGNYLLLQQEPWCNLHPYFDMTVMLNAEIDIVKARLTSRWMKLGYSQKDTETKISENDMLNVAVVLEQSRAADYQVSNNH